MATPQAPTDAEIKDFLGRLKTYRDGLSERDQVLMDAMVAAAVGKTAEAEEENDVSELDRVAVYLVRPWPVGYGAGYAVGGYGASRWGAAYGVRVGQSCRGGDSAEP